MRKFNLIDEYNSIISNNNNIKLICKIHEYKVKQSYLLETKKDTLETLLKVAKIQSISSSNKIEGIYTTITLDFVSIYPFNDGNGRMSRLLTLLLLYKANYLVGKYLSIERK